MSDHKRKKPDTVTSPGDDVHTPQKNKKQKTKNPYATDVDDLLMNDKQNTTNPYANHVNIKLSSSSSSDVGTAGGTSTSTISHVDSVGNPGVNAENGTVALAHPKTPPDQKTDVNELQKTPPSITSKGRSLQLIEAKTDLKLECGEYVLKIEKRSISSSTYENKKEEAKQLAQDAGMMFLQAEMLRNMGEQLLAKYRASLQHIFEKSVPKIDLPDQ